MANGIFGDISNWLFGDNNNNQNPANAAQPYLNQLTQMLPGYYNPYISAGLNSLPGLQQQYGALMNPNFINTMGQNFQQSPGYQFQVNQALGAANRAAAAGGMAGSPQEQQQIASTTNQLANQDYYNWLDHAMNAYGMGLQGQQGLYNTGFNASNELAQNMGGALESQANLGYAGQINQNEMNQGNRGASMGFVGDLLGGLLGAGGGFGNGNSSWGSSYGMPNLGWLGNLVNWI